MHREISKAHNSSGKHDSHKGSHGRRALSVVLAFLMGLAIFCGIFSIEMRFGWLSCQGLYQTMVGGGYAYKHIQQTKEALGTLLEEAGLSEDLLGEAYSEDKLYGAYIKNVEAILLKGADPKKETSELGAQLVEAAMADLQAQGVTVTPDLQEQIEQTGMNAQQIYESAVSASFVEKFRQMSEAFNGISLAVLAASLVIVAAGVLVLLKLYHSKHHAVQYVTASLLFALLCNIAAVAVVGRDSWIRESGIGPEAYRAMLEQFNLRSLEFAGLVTLAGLVVLFGLCILIQRLKKK